MTATWQGPPPSDDDARLARDLAVETGRLLLRIRAEHGTVAPDDRGSARVLRDTADRAAHDLIVERLAAERPDDAVLSEEGPDDPARLEAGRLWIVDPLDGTWEYGQGRADFAVHVALWWASGVPGGSLTAAAFDLPAQGRTWSVLDSVPGQPGLPVDRPVRVVVSRTRRPEGVDAVAERLAGLLARDGITDRGVEIVPVGSVGAKVGELLAGRADAYVHDTGFHEWDLAAPLCVAMHRGYWCAPPGGGGFAFNRLPPLMSGALIAVPVLAPYLRAVLAG